MSKVKVIANLHNTDGFRAEDGWEMKWWHRCLPIKAKVKKGERQMYNLTDFKRPYALF